MFVGGSAEVALDFKLMERFLCEKITKTAATTTTTTNTATTTFPE